MYKIEPLFPHLAMLHGLASRLALANGVPYHLSPAFLAVAYVPPATVDAVVNHEPGDVDGVPRVDHIDADAVPHVVDAAPQAAHVAHIDVDAEPHVYALPRVDHSDVGAVAHVDEAQHSAVAEQAITAPVVSAPPLSIARRTVAVARKVKRADKKIDGGLTCPEKKCGRAFSRGDNLKRHMQIHAAVKPFACSACTDARFTTKQGLQRHHLALHTNEGPFVCRVPGCGQKLSSTDIRRRHEKRHAERDSKEQKK